MQKQDTWKMFNQIYKSYDFLNRLLSFGIDQYWRKKLVQKIHVRKNMHILDVATGTGDLLIAIQKAIPDCQAIGVDMSENMLSIAKKKAPSIHFYQDNACCLSVQDQSIDLLTISFGIRNVKDPLLALKEFKRVLKPKSQVFILEFSIPRNKIIKRIYLLYFRYVLPFIGGFFSKNIAAYTYLNQSVENFPQGHQFLSLMNDAGFVDLSCTSITLGVVTLYIGKTS